MSVRVLAVGFGAVADGVNDEGVLRLFGEADAVVSDAEPELFGVAFKRKRRKTTVSHHLARDSLPDLLSPVFEHLQIQMAVKIDKSRSNRQSRAVNRSAIAFDVPAVDPGNSPAINEYGCTNRRLPGPIDKQAIPQKKHHAFLSA